jgi:hypothetical protein
MDLFAPYAGTLLLPDKAPFGSTSPVTFADGTPAAAIRWHRWSARARFEILDAGGPTVLATGRRAGFGGRNYYLADANEAELLHLKLGFWGANGRSTLTLPAGRTLHAKGNWSSRRFVVSDDAGQPVAHLVNQSRRLSWRPDSLAFELLTPVLSVVQAIGLAQSMRAAVESNRASTAAAAGG